MLEYFIIMLGDGGMVMVFLIMLYLIWIVGKDGMFFKVYGIYFYYIE